MKTFNPGNLMWFGTAPTPPAPKPFSFGWNPALSRFKPFTLPIKQLARSSQANTDFVGSVRAMMSNVHPGIQAPLIKYGVAVLPVKDIYDISLWLPYSAPRGHQDRFSWKRISGCALFEGHLLVVGRNREDHNGRYVCHDNHQGLFNHELGHCLDRALNLISASPEFLACWAADAANISGVDRQIYQYFLQASPTGPSETFADCFACVQGLSSVEYWTTRLPILFPSSFKFVQDLVERLKGV